MRLQEVRLTEAEKTNDKPEERADVARCRGFHRICGGVGGRPVGQHFDRKEQLEQQWRRFVERYRSLRRDCTRLKGGIVHSSEEVSFRGIKDQRVTGGGREHAEQTRSKGVRERPDNGYN